MKESLEEKKIRAHVLERYPLILASWIALHSAFHPIFKIGEGALHFIPCAHSRILDVCSVLTSQFVVLVHLLS